jgi:DNA-binding transcriptional regulator YdaS (Cro superfamily)
MTPEQSLQEAIRRAGGQRALARHLGIAQQAVSQWRVAPATRARAIEHLTGVRAADLRPDVFGPDYVSEPEYLAGLTHASVPLLANFTIVPQFKKQPQHKRKPNTKK